MNKFWHIILNILLKVLLGGVIFFVVTFTIYFFNLDMKATTALEPLFTKHYDSIPRDRYL